MFFLSIDCGMASMAYAYAETLPTKEIKYLQLYAKSLLGTQKDRDVKLADRIKLIHIFYCEHIRNKKIDLCLIEQQKPMCSSYDVSVVLYTLCVNDNIKCTFVSASHKNKVKLYPEPIKKYASKHAQNEAHTYKNFLILMNNIKYESSEYNNTLKYDVAASHVQLYTYLLNYPNHGTLLNLCDFDDISAADSPLIDESS